MDLMACFCEVSSVGERFILLEKFSLSIMELLALSHYSFYLEDTRKLYLFVLIQLSTIQNTSWQLQWAN